MLLLSLAGWQCLDSPNFPDTPVIKFISLSKDSLNQGVFQEDSLIVKFSFTDGDGDIGRTDKDSTNDIFFIDLRTGTQDNTFGIPEIPQEGAGNGVEGVVKIVLFTTCCIYPKDSINPADPCRPNPNIPFDTLQYRIYIKDNAGHKSNEILTAPIILRCN
ncbi:MAG: hypothetical protein IPP15_18105 [Saprospiraceae bacterium]|uniref:Uncharacterized protein n=1 Tax=Candidatus Opimibacter skivensis TaxID=2982028 RepID=A0A9D7SXX2_9BACT|nr:hypothetical protein [Candidatus Opimibacter skivensis]